MQGWHLLCRNPYQDCLSNGSNVKTTLDLAEQQNQLLKQVQGVQFSCHLHSPLQVKHGPCFLTPKKRIQAFETKCLRKLLRLSYLEHTTNVWVRSNINFLVGPHESLLTTVKRRTLAWFRHVSRHDSLSQNIPAHARTAHNGLLQKRLEEDLC